MIMKKFTLMAAVALLAGSALMTGCQKDFDGVLRLAVENFDNGDTKLAVNGTHSTWANGDVVRINGAVYTVSVNGSNEASISGVPGAENFYAVYPGSLCGELTTSSATLNLPSTYQYRTSGGKQILELPMMGYLDPNSDSPYLMFNHVTGALVIRIRNGYGTAGGMFIDSIQVISNSYKMNGSFLVDVTDPNSAGGVTTGSANEKKVTMLFQNESLNISYGDTVDVMLPVPAVGADNVFTIRICSHTRLQKFVFERTQSAGMAGALARNQVGYAYVPFRHADVPAYITESDILDSDGSGNYLIKTPDDYRFVVEACNSNWVNSSREYFRTKSYKINNNIDMTGVVVEPINANFSGCIDGNNKTISNMTIESSTSTRVAMFASTTQSNPIVKDLTLSNITVSYTGTENTNTNLAGFVGLDASSQTYSGCKVYGITFSQSNIATDKYISMGGIVGRMDGRSTASFEYCEASNIQWGAGTTSVACYLNIGGLVGTSQVGTTIESCNYTATMPLQCCGSKGVRWGALVGEQTGNLNVSYCDPLTSNGGYLRGSSVYAGGVVGKMNSGTITLDEVYVEGTINAHANYYYIHDISYGATISGTYTGSITETHF